MSTATTTRNSPFVLIIRDGWGENPNPDHDAFNAIKIARTPTADRLDRDWPRTLIATSGEDVGLPAGTMGNSEVGHQNIGAGRIVDQAAVRISKACRANNGLGLADNHALREAVRASLDRANAGQGNARVDASEQEGRVGGERGVAGEGAGGAGGAGAGGVGGGGGVGGVHVMGLASDAGVHSLLEHLYAVVRACKHLGQDRVYLHLFTDGRDTGPFTGKGFVERIEAECAKIGAGTVATICGRYWAMDRDFRWERVERAYRAMTGVGAQQAGIPTSDNATHAIDAYYNNPAAETMKGDEFVPPTMIGATEQAIADSRIHPGDAVIFFNFRGDRPREIVSAFVLPDDQWAQVKPSPDSGVPGFDRGERLGVRMLTMMPYSEALEPHVSVIFRRPERMRNIAGEYIASLGLRQFRCAETEKYPHVTFFFNDYKDEPFDGEQRNNPQSPRVKTYDLAPEMSAEQVCRAVLDRLADDDCEQFIVVNFANPDMVGHTGSLEAAVKACEKVDQCVGRIIDAALARDGSLIVTADHGNAEQMWSPENDAPHTAHTTYTVPLYVVGEPFRGKQLRAGGRLGDIVPTALSMMGLDKPAEMTGESLLAD